MSTNCTGCGRGFTLKDDGTCECKPKYYDECPTHTFRHTDGTCIECHDECMECDGAFKYNCTKCAHHMELTTHASGKTCECKECPIE